MCIEKQDKLLSKNDCYCFFIINILSFKYQLSFRLCSGLHCLHSSDHLVLLETFDEKCTSSYLNINRLEHKLRHC